MDVSIQGFGPARGPTAVIDAHCLNELRQTARANVHIFNRMMNHVIHKAANLARLQLLYDVAVKYELGVSYLTINSSKFAVNVVEHSNILSFSRLLISEDFTTDPPPSGGGTSIVSVRRIPILCAIGRLALIRLFVRTEVIHLLEREASSEYGYACSSGLLIIGNIGSGKSSVLSGNIILDHLFAWSGHINPSGIDVLSVMDIYIRDVIEAAMCITIENMVLDWDRSALLASINELLASTFGIGAADVSGTANEHRIQELAGLPPSWLCAALAEAVPQMGAGQIMRELYLLEETASLAMRLSAGTREKDTQVSHVPYGSAISAFTAAYFDNLVDAAIHFPAGASSGKVRDLQMLAGIFDWIVLEFLAARGCTKTKTRLDLKSGTGTGASFLAGTRTPEHLPDISGNLSQKIASILTRLDLPVEAKAEIKGMADIWLRTLAGFACETERLDRPMGGRHLSHLLCEGIRIDSHARTAETNAECGRQWTATMFNAAMTEGESPTIH